MVESVGDLHSHFHPSPLFDAEPLDERQRHGLCAWPDNRARCLVAEPADSVGNPVSVGHAIRTGIDEGVWIDILVDRLAGVRAHTGHGVSSAPNTAQGAILIESCAGWVARYRYRHEGTCLEKRHAAQLPSAHNLA